MTDDLSPRSPHTGDDDPDESGTLNAQEKDGDHAIAGTGRTRHTRKVTIRDVAEAAGVAPSTVSRAFSRPGRVSSATAQRILAIANDLGYRIDDVAPFRTEESLSALIGIVVADLSNPVFADYTRSAQHECLTQGLGLLVIDSEENMLIERDAIRLAHRHVDGLILASSRLSDTGIRKLAETKPLIALNRSIRGIRSAVADASDGLRQAVDYLALCGHRTITYLSGPESSWQEGMRWRALSAICSSTGLRLRRIPSASPTFGGGYRCGDPFLSSPTTAVIAYNDMLAIGFIAALHASGISVPAQVSVVGIDDIQFSSLVTPALTTIRLPRRQVAAKAVEELSARLHHLHEGNLRPVILPSRFIRRASTGSAPQTIVHQ